MQFRMALVASLLGLMACSGGKDDGEACTATTITVTVTDANGAPIPTAVVYALPSLAPQPQNRVACAGTDATFTCTVPSTGAWKVYSEAQSFEPFGTEVNIADGVCDTPLAITMQSESAA